MHKTMLITIMVCGLCLTARAHDLLSTNPPPCGISIDDDCGIGGLKGIALLPLIACDFFSFGLDHPVPVISDNDSDI